MSSNVAIQLKGIEKTYYLYKRPLDLLIRQLVGKKAQDVETVSALKDISFEVKPGETLGIVGHNGSGKSTLLQIIAGTVTPSAGLCITEGRVSALLELGAGFNPEFTGVENARISASIMGLSSEEFEQKLPEIIEFSELAEFIHRPVKTYSSGMYVRLAFSVAISVEPDILIIDEALAVGDVRFQRKCFRKIETLKENNVAILFVTHSPQTLVNICDRAILLEHGEIVEIGDPKMVTNHYMQRMLADQIKQPGLSQTDSLPSNLHDDLCQLRPGYNQAEHRYGDGTAKIIDFMLATDAHQLPVYRSRDLIKLDVLVRFDEAIENIIYGLTIKTIGGTELYNTNTKFQDVETEICEAGNLVQVSFEFTANLIKGDYFISLGVVQDQKDRNVRVLDRRYDLIHLAIDDDSKAIGIADLDATIAERKTSAETLYP